MARGRNWTTEEKQLVMDNPDLPEDVLAEKIGRTPNAVRDFRHRLKYGAHGIQRNDQGQQFDERPSGWYGEHIGLLLMLPGFEDAFGAWLHYHRYVEYKVVERPHRGWIYLMCRRDASAP